MNELMMILVGFAGGLIFGLAIFALLAWFDMRARRRMAIERYKQHPALLRYVRANYGKEEMRAVAGVVGFPNEADPAIIETARAMLPSLPDNLRGEFAGLIEAAETVAK
jgi:hypothetical protein